MLERDIEKVLVREVRKLGGRAYKWISPGNDGVPDRIVVFPNRPPVFVELKAENGKLSALQKVQIKRLQDMGAGRKGTERNPGGGAVPGGLRIEVMAVRERGPVRWKISTKGGDAL